MSLGVVICWWFSNSSRLSRIIKNLLLVLESNLGSKGLKINNKKTKILISNHNTPTQVDNSKYPCGICSIGVGKNSIYCNSCKHWVHQCCTNLQLLRENLDFKCCRWFGHLQHRSNDNLPKKVMDFQIPGANIRGGQKKKKWIHTVKKNWNRWC